MPDLNDAETLADRLLSMSEVTFAELVAADRRMQSDHDAQRDPHFAALRHDRVLDRWLETINQTHAEITKAQIFLRAQEKRARAHRDADGADVARRQRGKALRALEGTNQQRREAKALIGDRNRRTDEEAARRRRAAREERHRLHCESAQGRAYETALRQLRDAHPDEFEMLRAAAEIEEMNQCLV
ncbi:hypothetical protein CcI49_23240 [Frankia sp. CcI49]|uniref:hypothetical protein n=1 Tax=Frankia sp. CcI49 TaxID=1745382 RepID=UPI00097899ED|nr:hypothetical protein [Frankia sp. CcI49]ONH58373.1 hypothetical protein CcI49_23240 [Frankia sp. CcI49]